METITSSGHTARSATRCRDRSRTIIGTPAELSHDPGKFQLTLAQNRGALQKLPEQTQNWIKLGGKLSKATCYPQHLAFGSVESGFEDNLNPYRVQTLEMALRDGPLCAFPYTSKFGRSGPLVPCEPPAFPR